MRTIHNCTHGRRLIKSHLGVSPFIPWYTNTRQWNSEWYLCLIHTTFFTPTRTAKTGELKRQQQRALATPFTLYRRRRPPEWATIPKPGMAQLLGHRHLHPPKEIRRTQGHGRARGDEQDEEEEEEEEEAEACKRMQPKVTRTQGRGQKAQGGEGSDTAGEFTRHLQAYHLHEPVIRPVVALGTNARMCTCNRP